MLEREVRLRICNFENLLKWMYVLFMGFKSPFLCKTEYSCLIVMPVQIEGQIVSFLHSFIYTLTYRLLVGHVMQFLLITPF